MTRPLDPARVRADAPLAYRLKDACDQLGVSRTTLWRRIASGDVPTIKFGGVTLIPGDALRALVEWEGKPKMAQMAEPVAKLQQYPKPYPKPYPNPSTGSAASRRHQMKHSPKGMTR
jgi:excisionase family DNA binding protein